MRTLKWKMDLQDGLSGPAKKMQDSMERVSKQLAGVADEVRGLDKVMKPGRPAWMDKLDHLHEAQARARRTLAEVRAAEDAAARAFDKPMKPGRPLWMEKIEERKAARAKAIEMMQRRAEERAAEQAKLAEKAWARTRENLRRGGMGGLVGLAEDVTGGLSKIGFAAQGILIPLQLIAGAARAVGGALATLGEAAYNFWRFAVEKDARKGLSQKALMAEFRDPNKASKTFADTQRFAEMFSMPVEQVQDRLRELMGAGMSHTDAFSYMGMFQDMETMGVEGVDDIKRAIVQMYTKPVASMEELQQQFGEKANAGAVLEKLGESMGLGTGEKAQMAARKMISQGKVLGKQVAEAAKRYAVEKYGLDGVVGKRAAEGAKEIKSLERLLADRPTRYMQAADLSGAMESYRGFLLNLTRLTDPESPLGGRIIGIVGRIGKAFEELFSRYAGEEGFKRLERDLTAIVNIADRLADALIKIAKAVAFIGGSTFDVMTKDSSELSGGQRALKGLLSGSPLMKAPLALMPWLASPGSTSGASVASTAPSATLSSVAAGAHIGTFRNINITVHAPGAEGHAAGQAIADQVKPMVRAELAKALASLPIEAGAY